MKIKVLSFNIHKGFNWNNLRFTLHELKKFLMAHDADIVFLQEVIGENLRHRKNIQDYPLGTQLEFLADVVWPHFSYGKNAVYDHGDHGNAILSRFPIKYVHNHDLTLHKREQRGLLHCVVEVDNTPLHLLNTHLNLLQYHRAKQYQLIKEYMQKNIQDGRVLLGGDFNDWNQYASSALARDLSLQEVFKAHTGHYARTFPCAFPLLTLDRLYMRQMTVVETHIHHGCYHLSDHLPISCLLEL